jgi:hypothetical protein
MAVEPSEMLDHVVDAASFLRFVRALIEDRISEKDNLVEASRRGVRGWENHTIEDFLRAAVAWGESTGMGENQGLKDASAWKRVAVFLHCGKVYE